MGRLSWSSWKVLLLIVLILLPGCDQNFAPQTPIVNNTFVPATFSPVIETSQSNVCNWPPVQVSEIEVSSFYWSEDGTVLMYREKNGNEKWYVYTLSTGETREYASEFDLTETPDVFGIQNYVDFFTPPEGRYIVYTQSIQSGYAVYLKNWDERESVFLGNIKGRVDQNTWLDKGTKLILSIDWSSPLGAPEAYIYLVDILKKELKVIIPHTSEYEDITYFGVTPDESRVIFTSYSGNNRLLRLWNLKDNSTVTTKVQAPLTFKWLPNNQEFIAVGYQNSSLNPSIFIYNIDDNTVRYLLPFEVKAHPYIKSAIQISPNFRTIAFIDKDHQNLYTIDCSRIVP
ncbi:MAG: hypothetical protein ACOYYF_03500 [Chloroflexota bacterium]|nr:hypothetical protein [Chloroflexota bacterium]MBI5703740.1 hypothetical protein [Chloroflexota bacterium]